MTEIYELEDVIFKLGSKLTIPEDSSNKFLQFVLSYIDWFASDTIAKEATNGNSGLLKTRADSKREGINFMLGKVPLPDCSDLYKELTKNSKAYFDREGKITIFYDGKNCTILRTADDFYVPFKPLLNIFEFNNVYLNRLSEIKGSIK